MVILGLTGSIGMGKSTAAAVFRRLGVPVHDADAAVHRLIGRGGRAVAAVARAFPGVVRKGAVDRQALAARVFGDRAELRRLEALLHPLVRAEQERFLARAARAGRPLVVLDVPLLFETGADTRCDGVVVVSAPTFVQGERMRRRSGMTDVRLAAILARQTDDAQKRRRADFVVPTGLGRAFSLRAIRRIVKVASGWRGRHWPRCRGGNAARRRQRRQREGVHA